MDTTKIRTWAEIDLDALAHNYRCLRDQLPAGCRFLGVCKANAYGHGAVTVAKELERLGAEMLAVACVDEGIELRRAGIRTDILCLGQPQAVAAPLLVEYGITQMVEDMEIARALSHAAAAAGARVKIHVKVDTGMSRLGFLWQDGDHGALLDQMEELFALPGLEVEGMFTHFANADVDETYTMVQFTRFLDAKAALEQRGHHLEICHCAASAAMLNYPCTHMDMVRPGLAMYGFSPMEDDDQGLVPLLTLKSRISAIRALPAGTKVSYGCTAVLTRDSRIAVIPVGYGDGYPRALSNQGQILVRGQRCSIVGRVCMDMCMVDVTDVPEARTGDVVTVYDEELLEQDAKLAGTIPYELMCDLAPRIPRLYLRNSSRL